MSEIITKPIEWRFQVNKDGKVVDLAVAEARREALEEAATLAQFHCDCTETLPGLIRALKETK